MRRSDAESILFRAEFSGCVCVRSALRNGSGVETFQFKSIRVLQSAAVPARPGFVAAPATWSSPQKIRQNYFHFCKMIDHNAAMWQSAAPAGQGVGCEQKIKHPVDF